MCAKEKNMFSNILKNLVDCENFVNFAASKPNNLFYTLV